MSPSKKMSRLAIALITAAAVPALSLSGSSTAFAETVCPTGWNFDGNNSAIDGIFCDRLAVTGGSFTVPDGIDEIQVLAVGGGGGGGAGGKTTIMVAGGGGGAGGFDREFIEVVAGDTINYTVGTGGAPGSYTVVGGATSGANGTDSTVSIGAGPASVTAQGGRGGVNGEDGGTGGAAGNAGAYLGGAGSSANPLAGGGGGGWFSAGVAGVEGANEKAGNGGNGHEYYSYPSISHPTHSAYPDYETLMWNTNGNPETYFLDRMGYGGGAGVVLDSSLSCTGDDSQWFGYSIPEDSPVSQTGQSACAIQGVEDYAAAASVTAMHAGNGGSGGAGTGTYAGSQGSAGYGGFVYFRIFVADETSGGGGGGGDDSGSEPLAQTGASPLAGIALGFAGLVVLLTGLVARFARRKNHQI